MEITLSQVKDLTCTLCRADTGDNPAALFHSTDALIQLRLPAALAGNARAISITIRDTDTTGERS